ncbi:uncharacterized protein EI90DRAFT_3047865 [Cantharellus anzutake]|uniref:uncharacterized protein n=1 Tax=Cantharellus anzutake TaxID=1750568 RepID=UPI0019087BBB|nr:uncharacterized protein EI90DRAFT_3047865 [Cantharellus anzutake]KAF8335305.1 hypothetical protein EI90DRAFT_3047865 [Cantharellus anzutake]
MSEVKLYIGNLSYHTDDESLRRVSDPFGIFPCPFTTPILFIFVQAFGDYGTVVDSIVMVDRVSVP